MEAQEANRNGCFTIGNISKVNENFTDVTLDNVIKLEMANSKGNFKEYSLEKIYDLQSRLMLLGGGDNRDMPAHEKQKEKEYFVKVCSF